MACKFGARAHQQENQGGQRHEQRQRAPVHPGRDVIQPVPKGEHGGDVVQQVRGATGQACGTILWESKRTKNWSDGWLAKLECVCSERQRGRQGGWS